MHRVKAKRNASFHDHFCIDLCWACDLLTMVRVGSDQVSESIKLGESEFKGSQNFARIYNFKFFFYQLYVDHG